MLIIWGRPEPKLWQPPFSQAPPQRAYCGGSIYTAFNLDVAIGCNLAGNHEIRGQD